MTATSPRAFLLSLGLHAAVAVLLIFLSLTLSRQIDDTAKIFELVAGEGDNFAAREAPALGVEGGVKMSVSAPPSPPAPVTPAPVTPAPPKPVEPAPVVPPAPPPVTPAAKAPKTTAAPTSDAVPDFKKKIQRAIVIGDSKAKLQIKKEREAEKKRQAEEKKRLTKEEFDRAQRAAGGSTKVASAKVTPIDGEGIAKGVIGGSTNNKVGGAGGKALRTDNDDVMGAYYAMFKQRLRVEFEPPPGLSDSLKATIEVKSNADGSLSGARVTRSSGSREYDAAVLEAIRRVRMPPHPAGRPAETIEFVFSMRERDEG